MDPLWWLIPAALAAGFIDSIVGGGGVITLPALVAAGVPPHAAIATNKVAGTGASSMATFQYIHHGLIRPRLAWVLTPLAALAAAAGAATVLQIPEDLLVGAIAVVMVIMVAYVLLRPSFGQQDHFLGMSPKRWVALLAAVVPIAFYDGLLGPGTGTLLLFGLVSILGMGFVAAATHGRVINFGSNIGALGWFAFAGIIDWRLGLGMMIGTTTGAYIGSHMTVRHGQRWVKPLFVVMALVLLVRLILT